MENEKMSKSTGEIYLLTRTNVDGYDTIERFNTKPSKQDLFKFLFDYFDEETSHRCAEELFKTGYTSVNDNACTEYELSQL